MLTLVLSILVYFCHPCHTRGHIRSCPPPHSTVSLTLERNAAPQVNSNTTHFIKGMMPEAWEGSDKEKAVLEVNEKRKERVNASEATATGAGEGEGTPAKKKAKTTQSESKKVVEPIRVLDFATFLTEFKLGDDWGAAMETADFSKDKYDRHVVVMHTSTLCLEVIHI